MKWFDEHKEQMAGSDDEAPGNSYSAVAKVADAVLDGETMIQFVREGFGSQKSFGEFIGVGESTVAGWMKTGSFPDYAKRATLAAYYSNKYFRKLKEAKRDATRPKVVKDGDRYMIIRLSVDEVGVAIGEVLARDIPAKKTALVFAGATRAWDLLKEAGQLINHEIESMDPDDSEWIRALREEIRLERGRTFHHDKLLANRANELLFETELDEANQNLEKGSELPEKEEDRDA